MSRRSKRPLRYKEFRRRILYMQVAAFAIKLRGTGMQRRAAWRFLVDGAELHQIERLVIVGRDLQLAQLERLAQGISHVVGHIGMDDHRPATEIDAWNRLLQRRQTLG